LNNGSVTGLVKAVFVVVGGMFMISLPIYMTLLRMLVVSQALPCLLGEISVVDYLIAVPRQLAWAE
jgi:hypothetical protein